MISKNLIIYLNCYTSKQTKYIMKNDWMLIFLSEVNASYSYHVGREGKNISFMQEIIFMRAF